MTRVRWQNSLIAAVVSVCSAFSLAFVCAAEPTVCNIGGARQLFLDDWIVAQTVNVVRQPGEAIKHAGNPIIKGDKPWDQGRCDLYGSAVYNPASKQLQVFYSAVSSPSHDDRLAYAVSNDGGATWSKPDLGLIAFNGDSHTNIVLNPTDGCYLSGPSVFFDAHETDPSRRYKLLTSEYNNVNRIKRRGFVYADPTIQTSASKSKSGMYVAFSPDGIHWTRPTTEPFSALVSDTEQSVFWDAALGKYVAYVRAFPGESFPGGPRSVGRMESNDFVTWSEPQTVLRDPANREIYSMGVTPYQGMYIGTPWIYDPNAKGDTPTKRVMWPELAVSRDGMAWLQPFPGKPLIPTGPPGSADFAQIRMASSLVVLDDRIVLIYGQTDRGHVADMRVDAGMATMRLDGFAAMTAGRSGGSILTKPLTFAGKRLAINAQTKDQGLVVVELHDATGKTIDGFSKSDPFRGDALRHVVTFNGNPDVSTLAGKPIAVRFQLADAKLFSFAFEH
jgi:hypothetical protein